MRSLIACLFAVTLACVALPDTAAETAQDASHVSLGVSIQPGGLCNANPIAKGALISGVRPGGSADRSGLKPGDLVVHFGGTEIEDWRDLPRAVQLARVGDRLDVTVRRGDALVTRTIQFTQADSVAPAAGGSSAPSPSIVPTQIASSAPTTTSCMSIPYQVLPLPPDAAQRAASLAGASEVSLQGDVLTIAHRASGETVQLSGSLQLPMTRVPGTQVWLTQLKMDGWERMFFSYQFIGSLPTSVPDAVATYRGAQAPPLPITAAHLQGQLIHTHLYSSVLNADRDITVYLPPRAEKGLSVLYMTDGQSVEGFARVLEPMILGH